MDLIHSYISLLWDTGDLNDKLCYYQSLYKKAAILPGSRTTKNMLNERHTSELSRRVEDTLDSMKSCQVQGSLSTHPHIFTDRQLARITFGVSSFIVRTVVAKMDQIPSKKIRCPCSGEEAAHYMSDCPAAAIKQFPTQPSLQHQEGGDATIRKLNVIVSSARPESEVSLRGGAPGEKKLPFDLPDCDLKLHPSEYMPAGRFLKCSCRGESHDPFNCLAISRAEDASNIHRPPFLKDWNTGQDKPSCITAYCRGKCFITRKSARRLMK